MDVSQGDYTKTVYSLILEEKYKDAINILEKLLDHLPGSRVALSLLGYCHYHLQAFNSAATFYERLVYLYPENDEYRFVLSETYYNAALYTEAMNESCFIDTSDPAMQIKVLKLQAAIKFCAEEISAARSLVNKWPEDDPDTYVFKGCLEFKDGNFNEALNLFEKGSKGLEFDARLWYNIAVTYYCMQKAPKAAEYIGAVVQAGNNLYPELGVGTASEGLELPSIRNTVVLHQSALIESLNLKAAIEYDILKIDGARMTIMDLPPREEHELDAITLHNHALLNIETHPTCGLDKLRFLLEQSCFPPETFPNLLILYIKYEKYDLIADLMAMYKEFKFKYLTPFLCNFFEALIIRDGSPVDAFKLLSEMATRIGDSLRKLVKDLNETKAQGHLEETQEICNKYDSTLTSEYLPVVMAQGKIYWEQEKYPIVEKVLRKAAEFCNDSDSWKLNVAHVLFMQGYHFGEATEFYEEIVRPSCDNLLDISAIILANLCVSYIMTNKNEEGELLMKRIEREEDETCKDSADSKIFHLCIVNMVIGTLYCERSNYDFGISRMMKSMDPFPKRLGPDTWFYTKRCILSMIENVTKFRITMREGVLADCETFLSDCEKYGSNVKTVIDEGIQSEVTDSLPLEYGKKTVAYEARVLKVLLQQLNDWV